MIYGRLPVGVAAAAAITVIFIISTSARRNSTASPCSCRVSEKAESSFSVGAVSFIFKHSHAQHPLVAPKPVTRHLVVAARPAEPTRSGPGDAASDPATFQNPPREAYPDEALTHRFRPYGDPGEPPPPPEDQLDLDMDDRHAEEGAAGEKGKERRKKRRGGEAADSPKKAKKAKTVAS